MSTSDIKLRTQSIPKLVISYTLTTFAALLFNSVYNLTDSLFVSWGVNVNASGAISVVLPFVLLQSAISTALGGGAGAIVSVKLGEGKVKDAGETALNAMLAFYATAIVVTIVGFAVMEPLLKLMGVTGELYGYAKEYFIIILAGNVFSTGFSSIIRAEGKMLYALLIWVIPISVNIILDGIFILVLGWGVKGSALATVICQATSFAMMVIFFVKFSKLDFKGARLHFAKLCEILKIGIPSLVQIGCLSLMTLIINKTLSKVGGTPVINAFAFVNKLIAFAVVPFTALTQAIMPIIGYNYGAKDTLRVKQTLRFSLLVAFSYAVLATVLAEAIPSYLMKIFTLDGEIIAIGENAIRILAASLVFTPLPLLIGASYQAQGDKYLSLVHYSAPLIFLLPFVFTLHLGMGINGVWLSYVLASVCATLFVVICLLVKKRKSSNKNLAL